MGEYWDVVQFLWSSAIIIIGTIYHVVAEYLRLHGDARWLFVIALFTLALWPHRAIGRVPPKARLSRKRGRAISRA
jgi:hypothetical protein